MPIEESVDIVKSTILTFEKESRTILVDARNEKEPSEQKVTLTLTAIGQLSRQIFKVKVVKTLAEIKQIEENNSSSEAQKRILTAKFESASDTGLVRIKFAENVISLESDAMA